MDRSQQDMLLTIERHMQETAGETGRAALSPLVRAAMARWQATSGPLHVRQSC